jgi:deoxyribonuclease I
VQYGPGVLASAVSLIRRAFVTLRCFVVALVITVVLSCLPDAVVTYLSPNTQRALSIAKDVRSLLFDVGRTITAEVGGLMAGNTIMGVDPGALLYELSTEPRSAPTALSDEFPGITKNFGAAKGLLYDQVYADHSVTFYCGCSYNQQGQIDLDRCNLGPLAGIKGADRVEADHIFSVTEFGESRLCWRKPMAFHECLAGGKPLSGPDCCERVDSTFAAAHNDLHNLVPIEGALVSKRSLHHWGLVNGGEHYGDCGIRFNPSIQRSQPMDSLRGDIARIMFYMSDTYGFRLSSQDTQLYITWNNADPPDPWEIERNRRITRIQGRGNHYIEDYRRF